MSDIFDDDEENPPVGFEQDPDEDELGIGTWKYADGTSRYSKGDAEDAKKLMVQPATGEPAEKTLGGVGAGSALDEQFLGSATGAERDELAEASESPKAIGGASPEPAAPPAPAESQQPAPLQAPRLPGAAGPSRYTDTTGQSQTQGQSSNVQSSVSRTGSAQDQGEFNQQQQNISDSYGAQKQAQDEGSAGVVDAIQQRRGQLMQLAQDREAATSAAMAQRDARANQVKTKIGEVSSRKTDHNKIWKDKGAFGTTLGLLGVALRSLTATKFGGPNTALQSVQEQKKQNIQSQMDDRDSELRGLERELGSLDAAVPMLEARMNDALGKRLEAMTLNEKSATVLANAKQMKAQFDTERDLKLAEAAKAYHGTLAQQQSQGSQQNSQQSVESGRSRLSGAGVGGEAKGKSREQVYDDLLERDKKMEERGIPKEERAQMWKEYGFSAPSGETAPESMNREQREKVARDEEAFSEDQAKAESAFASFGQYGEAFGLNRDPKTGKLVAPDGIKGLQSPAYQEKVPGAFGFATPIEDARTAAIEGIGRLQSGGVISGDEAERFLTMLGDDDITRTQLASKLNSLETLVNTRRKANRRDAPKGAPASWKKKPETETSP